MEERIWHRSYAPGISASFDFEEVTVPELLTRSAVQYPERTAFEFMGRRISFSELESLVNRFAVALQQLGVEKGEKVALLMPNIPQIVISYYAIWRIGAVPVPHNPLYTDRELTYQLNNSGATRIISLDLLTPRLLALKASTRIRTIISAHINDYLPTPIKQLFPLLKKKMYRRFVPEADFFQFRDLMKTAGDEFIPEPLSMADLALIPYTGGTTGVSKGAVLSHANLSYMIQLLNKWLIGTEDGQEGQPGIFPFFHMAGFTAVMNLSIYKGWTVYLIPRPEPEAVANVVLKHKPSLFLAVPTIYNGLLNLPHFRKADLSFIKIFFSGASALPQETIQALKALTDSYIVEAYGMTEATVALTCTPCGGKLKPGSVGVPLPETDLKIVDIESGTQEMPIGEPGEIIVKGPQMLSAYYEMPEETARAIRDGWFHTGDIGKLDEDGYLYIVDRKKDMIIAGGYNIYPRDIEEVLMQHPKILEACVIGIPHAYRGETVKAFIAFHPGDSATEEELDAYCREHLAAYKVPRRYEFMEELPKSPIGKILKRELRDRELAKEDSPRDAGTAAH